MDTLSLGGFHDDDDDDDDDDVLLGASFQDLRPSPSGDRFG